MNHAEAAMQMTRMILVRHGETEWNRQRRMQGHSDSPLSQTGLEQARRLARRLAAERFCALYSSDSGRAYWTARAIADATGHEIRIDVRLRERHFGAFEGLTAEEIERAFPEECARFRSRDPDFVVPGGESARTFRDRCLACLAEIATRHCGHSVIVVTHGLVLDMVYRAAEGLAFHEPRPVPLLNASLNVFRYAAGRWKTQSWGDVAHLAQEAVTEFQEGSA